MKKLFALVLAFCLVLTLVPAPAFAEGEPECTCETACTEELKNTDCLVCGAEGATPEKCGKYVAPQNPENSVKPRGAVDDDAVKTVQDMISALPDAKDITTENKQIVMIQLGSIASTMQGLNEEERAQLDLTKYNAANEALKALNRISIDEAVVDVTKTFTYDGTPKSLTADDITVTLDTLTLNANTDYTVTADSQTYPGSYSFTVNGIGNYSGTATGTWSIGKGSLSDQNIYRMMQENETSVSVDFADYLPDLGADAYIMSMGGYYTSTERGMKAEVTSDSYPLVAKYKVKKSLYYNDFYVYLHIAKVSEGTQKSLSVSMQDWTYGDQPNTPTVTGLPDPCYNYTVAYSKKDGTALSGVPTDAGEYKVTVTCWDSDNNIYTGSADFLIEQAGNGYEINFNTGKKDDLGRSILELTYGQSYTLSPTGKFDSLTYKVHTAADVISVDAKTGKITTLKSGTATIRAENEPGNYWWFTAELSVHVSKATVTVTAKDQTAYAGDSAPVLGDAYTVEGLVGEDTLNGTISLSYADDLDMNTPGTYDILVTYTGTDDRYDVTTASGTLTVSPQPTYTVHFDANGGEGTMADQTMTRDKSESLKANTFTLDGNIFRGWNTQPDGTGTPYADGETVQNLPAENGELYLYAQWDLIVDQVDLNLSGHALDKRMDGVKVTSEDNISFGGAAYGGAWGIATNKSSLKTLEGKTFQADIQYYLWVTFSPEEGCTLEGLTKENVRLDGTAALSLTLNSGLTEDGEQKPETATAVFRLPVIYTITVTAGKNGSVSSDPAMNAKGIIPVFEGDDVEVKITPDKDYVVYRLTVDGKNEKTARTYTFENIQQSHTLKARFLKNGTNAKTGDSFPLVPAIAVLTLSAAALAAVVVIAKKKKK